MLVHSTARFVRVHCVLFLSDDRLWDRGILGTDQFGHSHLVYTEHFGHDHVFFA